MSSDAVIIQIDLETNMNETFVAMEKQSKTTAVSVTENFSNGFSRTFKAIEKSSAESALVVQKNFSQSLKQISKSAEPLNNSLEKSSKNLSQIGQEASDFGKKIAKGFAIAIPIAVALESRFGIFTKLFAKMGLNLEDLKKQFRGIIDTIADFSIGEASITDIKLSIGKLLQDLGIIDSKAIKFITTIAALTRGAQNLGSAFSFIGASALAFAPLLKNLKGVTKLVSGIGGIVLKGGGLFGMVGSLAATSVGLLALSETLKQVDNSFAQFAANATKVASILIGGLAAAFTLVILKTAELGSALARQAIDFFKGTQTIANAVEAQSDIFVAAVDAVNRATGNAIGTSQRWQKVIDETATSLNLGTKELTKAAQEIVLTGDSIGLNAKQMEKLLKVSAEYAKINGKDVFQSSVAFIQALNGQSQGVIKFGVKLGEAAVQQFAFDQGIKKNINTLTEADRVQLRYNKLLKSYKVVSGLGAVAAGTFADAQLRLINNQKRLTTEIGKGARIIEDNAIIAFSYNLILDNISNSVLKVAGVLGAGGARLLQFGSFMLGLSFKIFGVIKAIKILNLVLASEVGIKTFTKNIPFINKSLDELTKLATGSSIKIRSLGDAMTIAAEVSKGLLTKALKVLTGQTLTTATVMNVLTGAFNKARLAATKLYTTLVPLVLPFLPLIAGVTAVVGGFVLFYKVAREVEERTGALSTLANVLSETLFGTSNAMAAVVNFAGGLKDKLFELGRKGFGLLVTAMLEMISLAALLAKKNPFGVFSKKSIAALSGLENKLKGFHEQLIANNFDLNKIGLEGGRALAGGYKKGFNLKEIINKLNQLKDQLINAGLSQKQIIQRSAEAQRAVVANALEASVIDQKEASDLLTKIKLDETTKILALNKKQANSYEKLKDAINKQLRQGAVRLMSAAFQEMGNAMAGNASGWDAFLGTILGILGDLAISMGVTIIATAEAITALKASLLGDTMSPIVLGGGLIALGAILKSVASSKGGDSSAGFTGGGAGGGIASPSGSTGAATSAVADSGERQAAQTNVSFVVNGDIIDSPDTGKRLAKVISDSFAKDGIVLNNLGAV